MTTSNPQSIYIQKGYYSREDYLNCLAEDWDIPVTTVHTLACLLDPSEDFDGLLTTLEDYTDLEA